MWADRHRPGLGHLACSSRPPGACQVTGDHDTALRSKKKPAASVPMRYSCWLIWLSTPNADDVIINTSNHSLDCGRGDQRALAPLGRCISWVGWTEPMPHPGLRPDFLSPQFTGSPTVSPASLRKMMEFWRAPPDRPDGETLPMAEINTAIRSVAPGWMVR